MEKAGRIGDRSAVTSYMAELEVEFFRLRESMKMDAELSLDCKETLDAEVAAQ